jgi:hypothetical protein
MKDDGGSELPSTINTYSTPSSVKIAFFPFDEEMV